MFRDRPLTWLFVIATICVDLVWFLTTGEGDSGAFESISNSRIYLYGSIGCFLAQSCVVTIYVVFAVSGKLTQASILVSANLALAYASSSGLPRGMDASWLALFSLHAIQAILVVAIARLFQIVRDKKSTVGMWRVSIIEMFGWTIIVAIVSFSYRFLDFSQLSIKGCALFLVPCLAMNLAAIWGLSRRSSVPIVLRVASPFLVVLILGSLFDILASGPGMDDLIMLSVSYAAYLCAWVVTRRMDIDKKPIERELVQD